jgi:hypothetical protein
MEKELGVYWQKQGHSRPHLWLQEFLLYDRLRSRELIKSAVLDDQFGNETEKMV